MTKRCWSQQRFNKTTQTEAERTVWEHVVIKPLALVQVDTQNWSVVDITMLEKAIKHPSRVWNIGGVYWVVYLDFEKI